ncbi:MAG TPA: acyltransferase [Polyangiaceae bacterium]|nr:acyltransferase [Polyangiaceae bacterium]
MKRGVNDRSNGHSLGERILNLIASELGGIRPRFYALDLAARTIPPPGGNRLRSAVVRRMGFQIGEGTVFLGTPEFPRGSLELAPLTIGRDCVVGVGCAFDLAEAITVGNGVNIGHQTLILTATHELGPREHRAGTIIKKPVTVEDGAWIGPRCIVLPGVTIGKGAVVAPGSLVNKDVAPHTRVGGTPIKLVDSLEP